MKIEGRFDEVRTCFACHQGCVGKYHLSMYHMSARELALRIMEDIKSTTEITAKAGIGINLYLAKVALDIMEKFVSLISGAAIIVGACIFIHQGADPDPRFMRLTNERKNGRLFICRSSHKI